MLEGHADIEATWPETGTSPAHHRRLFASARRRRANRNRVRLTHAAGAARGVSVRLPNGRSVSNTPGHAPVSCPVRVSLQHGFCVSLSWSEGVFVSHACVHPTPLLPAEHQTTMKLAVHCHRVPPTQFLRAGRLASGHVHVPCGRTPTRRRCRTSRDVLLDGVAPKPTSVPGLCCVETNESCRGGEIRTPGLLLPKQAR
jgi:hypothetical protein